MKKKLITIVIVGIFLLTSLVSMGVLADNQDMQSINKISEKNIDKLFGFIDEFKGIEFNPSAENLIKRSICTNGENPYIPGIHQFFPCDPIEVYGLGALSEQGLDLMIFLHDGTAALNNTYDEEFFEWEIAGIIILLNFDGEWSGSGSSPSDPMDVSGKSEQAILMEWSFLLEMTTIKDKYERGANIPLTISRFVFTFMNPDTIYPENPHFYMYHQGEFGSSSMVYDELIPETWTISRFGSKTWNWDQKDYEGVQVPDGNYSIFAECKINNRLHPVFGPYIEIVEDLSRNIKTLNNRFFKIIERFPNMFPLLRYLIGLE